MFEQLVEESLSLTVPIISKIEPEYDINAILWK